MKRAGKGVAVTVLLLGCTELCHGLEPSSAPLPAAEATLQRAEYTAWLVGSTDAAAAPDQEGAPPLPLRRPIGPTLVGKAELSVSGSGADESLCFLEGIRIAVERAEWEGGLPAQLGTVASGATVLRVPAGQSALHFEWSLAGEATPDGCTFRLQFPRASMQRLTLLLPEGVVPLMPGALIEGPLDAPQVPWREWHIGVPTPRPALLHLYRSHAVGAEPEILVTQSTAYDFSQAGMQWSVGFDLHVSQRPVEMLRFLVDGDVEIRDVAVSQPASVPGQFPTVSLHGDWEAPGRWTAALPDPLIGAAQVVLHGTAPLITDHRWQLPRIQLDGALWQQGTAELLVKAPLILIGVDAQHGRQTDAVVTVRDPGERHAFQFHEADGRISVVLGVRKPELRCRLADRLDWSADSVSLTSYGQWSTQSGQVFRLRYVVPPGWDVEDVRIQTRSDEEDWQEQPGLLRQWAQDAEGLEIDLAQPVTGQSAMRSVVSARRAARAEALSLSELLQFAPREAVSEGVLAATAVGPFRIQAEGLGDDLRVSKDAPELQDWRQVLPEPGRGLILPKDRRVTGVRLELLPQRADYQCAVAVRAAMVSDALVEELTLRCEPTQDKPLRRVLVYLSDGAGEALEWRLESWVATEAAPALPMRRLRPESHEQWGLPGDGELWEVVLPQAYSHAVSLVAQRRRAAEGLYAVPLPVLPEAAQVVGQVWVGASDSVRVDVAQQGLRLLEGPGEDRLSGRAGLEESASHLVSTLQSAEGDPLEQVGVWSYAGATAHLLLTRHASQTLWANSVSAANGRLICPYALVETTAPPTGLHETRITYWLVAGHTEKLRMRLPPVAGLPSVVVNGATLGTEAFDTDRRHLVVPLRRTDAMQTLSVQYRSEPRQRHTGPLLPWLLCPIRRVAEPLPVVDFTVGSIQWSVLLPEDFQVVTTQGSLSQLEAASARSWSQRLFGPLGRRPGSAPFDPWRAEQWESLLEWGAAAEPASPELAAPPGGPAAARRLAVLPPGWKRIWFATTLAPPELSLSVARNSSLYLMAAGAFFLGLVLGVSAWRVMPRRRALAIPLVLATGWSLAVAAPEALSMLGADLALGALFAAAWESWRRPRRAAEQDAIGSTVRQFAVTASALAWAAIVIATAVPAPLHGQTVQDVRATRSSEALRDSASGQTKGQPPTQERSGGQSPVAEPHEKPAYVVSGGQYDGTLSDGQLRLKAVYHVDVLAGGDGSAVLVRLSLDPQRAGLREAVRCTKDGKVVPVAVWPAKGTLVLQFTEPGEYEVQLDLAPLWDAPGADPVLGWQCSIPPLAQSRLHLKVLPGQGEIAIVDAMGAVTRDDTDNGTVLEASLGSATRLSLERRPMPRELRVEVSEALVLDLTTRPVLLQGWFRYQVSGDSVRRVYLSLESGMRAPRVWDGEQELASALLPVPPGAPPVAVVDLGKRRSGTMVLRAEVPVDRFQAQRPVGALRVPKVFARLVDRRRGLFAVGSGARFNVRVERPKGLSPLLQREFSERVADWGAPGLRQVAERVGLVVPWNPEVETLDLSIRPPDALPRADQTLSVEVHPDEIDVDFKAEITPDQASGYQQRLRVSPEIQVEQVKTEPQLLRRWQRSEVEPGELVLFFDESPLKPHTILLHGFVPGSATHRALPNVHLLGVQSTENLVVLYAAQGIGARLLDSKNLVQVPEYRVVKAQTEGAELKAVFRAAEADYSATVEVDHSAEVKPSREPSTGPAAPAAAPDGQVAGGSVSAAANAGAKPEATTTTLSSAGGGAGAAETVQPAAGHAVVLLADALYSLGETGQYVAQVTYWTASVPGGEIVFRLPVDADLLATTVSASSTDARRDNDGRYHVALTAASLPQTVVIRWQGKLDWPAALGDISLPAPVLESVEVQQTLWSVSWPPAQRRWGPMGAVRTIDPPTREVARLEVLLQQSQLLIDHRLELPQLFLEDRLATLLNSFAALLKREGGPGSPSNIEASHIQSLVDRAHALAEAVPVSVSWTKPIDSWLDGLEFADGLAMSQRLPEMEQVTFAAATSRQPGPALKVRVVAEHWLATVETVSAMLALWVSALAAGMVVRSKWFCAAPVSRNVLLLALLGLGWWLWLYPSFAGLLIILSSPLVGWLVHHRSSATPAAA